MGLDYRYEEEKAIDKSIALDAERQAASLESAVKLSGDEELKDRAKQARKRANSLKTKYKITPEEQMQVKRALYEEQIRGLEAEYVSHLRKKELKIGLDMDENIRDPGDGISIKQHDEALVIIEKAHKTLCGLIDDLGKEK